MTFLVFTLRTPAVLPAAAAITARVLQRMGDLTLAARAAHSRARR